MPTVLTPVVPVGLDLEPVGPGLWPSPTTWPAQSAFPSIGLLVTLTLSPAVISSL